MTAIGESGHSRSLNTLDLNVCFRPQAVIQMIRKTLLSQAEIGQKRPFVLLGKSLSISHLIEFERLEAVALGAISPQGRVL
jgi:hypothetical protein